MKPANLILTIASLLVLAPAFAQNAPPPPPAQYDQQGSQQPQQNAPLLTPEQLDTMVAPIALYPDPMLGQVLAASTYPLEVVEAQQWLQQNPNLHGQDLLNAARQQNWDPSVQALVAFPDILTLLNRDVRWTGDLGNAYLAQQQDVMNAVQRMRFRARANGRLESTPQQTVTTQSQNGQDAVVIEPANPQEVYVPAYNPDYVWGPPEYGYYPPLWYPSVGFGFGFGPGIYIGGLFPAWGGFGWGGWGLGWGWGCGWFGTRGIFVNNFFFSRYGFRGNGFYNGIGRFAWQHDAFHRGGVPYRNASVAARFNNSRFAAGRTNAGVNGSRSFAGRSFGGNTGRTFNGAASPAARAGGYSNAYRGNSGQAYRGNSGQAYRGNSGQAYRGNASPAPRAYSAPRSYSAPRAAPSAPRSFSGGGGGARSFGGGGGARSFGGGGGGGGHFSGGGGGHSGGGGHGGGHR